MSSEEVAGGSVENAEGVDDRMEIVVGSKKNKRKIQSTEEKRAEEAYKILKESVKRDDFTTYGEHISNEIRKLPSRSQAVVKHLLSNILFEAAMGKYEDPSASCSSCSSYHHTRYNPNPPPPWSSPEYSNASSTPQNFAVLSPLDSSSSNQYSAPPTPQIYTAPAIPRSYTAPPSYQLLEAVVKSSTISSDVSIPSLLQKISESVEKQADPTQDLEEYLRNEN